jgi:hypothetical protein
MDSVPGSWSSREAAALLMAVAARCWTAPSGDEAVDRDAHLQNQSCHAGLLRSLGHVLRPAQKAEFIVRRAGRSSTAAFHAKRR